VLPLVCPGAALGDPKEKFVGAVCIPRLSISLPVNPKGTPSKLCGPLGMPWFTLDSLGVSRYFKGHGGILISALNVTLLDFCGIF
jgi:hypothetical protein